MFRWTTIFIAALAAGAAQAHDPAAHHAGAATGFAIPNPLRPGAKAPDCTTLKETSDGCTFHFSEGETLEARLPADSEGRWAASVSDAALVDVRPDGKEAAPYQRFAITPRGTGDADLTVTFDRVVGAADSRRIVERRRATLMIHAH